MLCVLPFKNDLVSTFQSLFGGSSSESLNFELGSSNFETLFDFGFSIFFSNSKASWPSFKSGFNSMYTLHTHPQMLKDLDCTSNEIL